MDNNLGGIYGIMRTRRDKAAKLRELGIDPYPEKIPEYSSIASVRDQFEKFSGSKKAVAVVGRIVGKRAHGGITFADIKDASGKIQLFFSADTLKADFGKLELLDIGDFLWASGALFKTKAGEETLDVRKFVVLAKALRPIPSEWYGLENAEERFRKRYLDLLMNDEVKKRFETRSKIIQRIREFLADAGFMEVETPILQPLYGGARARPFTTHHHYLDIDLYLRIAPELYLKRLLVGGFEKVYELGRIFRNEGIDREHNPEFTMLELYWAYQDAEGLMRFCEKLITEVTRYVRPDIKLPKTPWPQMTFSDALKKAVGHEYENASLEELKKRGRERGLEFEPGISKGKAADEIIKKLIIPHILTPTFLVHHPVEISPLAKRKDNNIASRFQILIGGMEMANAFSELNDPIEQRERFEAQEKIRKTGDEEAMRYDEDFVEALEYGMPPAAGLGLGIDRLAAWLTGADSLKEIILFPMLKPK